MRKYLHSHICRKRERSVGHPSRIKYKECVLLSQKAIKNHYYVSQCGVFVVRRQNGKTKEEEKVKFIQRSHKNVVCSLQYEDWKQSN